MKSLKIAAVLIAASCTPAAADGPGGPWERTPVETPRFSWSGFMFGAGISVRKRTDTTTTTVTDGYTRTCVSGGSGHSDQKCQVSSHDWENSPEIQALRDVNSPWNKSGLRNDGVPGEIVRYDNAGYSGIWLNDQPSFTYTIEESQDPGGSRGASLGTAEEILRDLVTLDEDEELTGSIHLRRLWDTGSLVFGAELGHNGSEAYVEGQVGISAGRVLPYIGGGSAGASIGLDLALGHSFVVGGRANFRDEGTFPEVRAAIRF